MAHAGCEQGRKGCEKDVATKRRWGRGKSRGGAVQAQEEEEEEGEQSGRSLVSGGEGDEGGMGRREERESVNTVARQVNGRIVRWGSSQGVQ